MRSAWLRRCALMTLCVHAAVPINETSPKNHVFPRRYAFMHQLFFLQSHAAESSHGDGRSAHPAAELFIEPPFLLVPKCREIKSKHFLYVFTRAREHAAPFFCLSPVSPNGHVLAVVRPTPPPICSFNPLLVSAGVPINKKCVVFLIFPRVPANMHQPVFA